MNKQSINACAFIIRSEAGQVTAAGIITFRRLHTTDGMPRIETVVRVHKDELVAKFVASMPPGGYGVTDKMTGGRIELIFSKMDSSIPFRAVTDAIENLRDHFDVQLSAECVAEAKRIQARKTIAVKPNPAKS